MNRETKRRCNRTSHSSDGLPSSAPLVSRKSAALENWRLVDSTTMGFKSWNELYMKSSLLPFYRREN